MSESELLTRSKFSINLLCYNIIAAVELLGSVLVTAGSYRVHRVTLHSIVHDLEMSPYNLKKVTLVFNCFLM